MISRIVATALFASALTMQAAQQEGPVPTQTIVSVDSKNPQTLTASNIKLRVNRRDTPVQNVIRVAPNGTQVAILIDDGLRSSFGRQLGDISDFIKSLPAGTEIFLGYMQNGRVLAAQPFTTDHDAAAQKVRLTIASPGVSASPYFCLQDFLKNWPGDERADASVPMGPKARFVMMLTNGVDPYNGSVSPLNQNSPYVDAAIADAQRAGVPVYSIYYSDIGMRGPAVSFSGQSYLQAMADGTGGMAYFQGNYSPVSLTPFLKKFNEAIAESYIVSYDAAGTRPVYLEMKTTLPKTRLHAPQNVMPGTQLKGE